MTLDGGEEDAGGETLFVAMTGIAGRLSAASARGCTPGIGALFLCVNCVH
jgi:hypothetical protein